ncbi:MAG: tetratricopeptide repeat protein, partial [Fulvivirga sp.]|uniref:tetratricopeptide repeat protein n=1 Tax=Fulvivirga sp. TaxID=1931237 RepID=UPI0032ED462E
MNNFVKPLILTLCLGLAVSFSYGQKWDKYIDKADEQYEEGDYEKAKKTLDKFKKKVIKKLGANNEYMPGYHLRSAKFNLALGYLSEYQNGIENSLQSSISANGENSSAHGQNLIAIAEIVAHYGNYVESKNYLDKGIKTLQETDSYDENTKAKTELTTAEILTGQGYYTKALKYIEEHLEYFRSRAVTKESYVDESGKLKTRKLDDGEVKERLGDYANLLTLKSNALRLKGSFKSADSAFVRSEAWISSNLGIKDIRYVKNQFLHGKLLVENGLDVDNMPKETRFDKTLDKLKRDYEESHYLAFDLYETLLKQYLYTNEKGKYKGVKIEYEKAIKRNFRKTSLHYLNLETIEFDSKLTKDRTRNLEAEANAILSTTRALPKYHQKRITLLEFLYRLDIQKRNFTHAEENLREILEIEKNLYGEESPAYHLGRLELANHFVDYTDNFEEANKIYQESFFNIIDNEIDTWHKDYVEILNHLATYYEITDQYKLASETLDKALFASRAKYDNQDPDYGVELTQIADLQLKLGQYENAESNLNDAVSILESVRKDEYRVVDYVDALQTQAKLLSVQGLFDEAESNINNSGRLLRRARETVVYDELAAGEELASLYITLGKYSDTEELLDELIAGYQSRYGSSSRRLINPLINKGKLQLINGDYPKAEKTAKQALAIANNTFGEKSSKTAPALKLLSEVNSSIGDYDNAEDNIRKAIAIQRAQFGNNHVDVAKSLTDLGLIKFHNGHNLKEAEKIMEEAKDIIASKLGNRNPTYANILTDLAKVYISERRYDDAFNSLTLAENIWVAKIGKRNNINAAAIYTLIGDIYYLQRNYDLAEEQYEKSKKLYERFFNRNHPEYVKIISKLSKVYYMEGDTKQSLKNIEEALANYQIFIRDYFPALSEREKAKYWNTIKSDYEFYNTLAFSNMKDDSELVGDVFNNALLTKAILLNSSIKIRERILNSNDEDLKNKYNNWIEKKEQLTNAISMSAEQLAENQIDPAALSNEVEALEKELSQKSELFSQSFEDKKIQWEDVKTVLKPNEVAIEMVRFRHFDHTFTDSVVYAAMYVKNDKDFKEPKVILINNGKELENRYFKNYRNSIIFRLNDTYSYDQYWKPIEEVVGQFATVYLSADGVYNQINLESVPTSDGKYVIDKSNIILVSNTKDIYIRQVKTQLVQEEKRAS